LIEPGKNTDTELWRESPGDYYAASIHVTADGKIGIRADGSVAVASLREWHALSEKFETLLDIAEQALGEVDFENRQVLAFAGLFLLNQVVADFRDTASQPAPDEADWQRANREAR
jgi:hypothetical protein